jgi:hypothetical protein
MVIRWRSKSVISALTAPEGAHRLTNHAAPLTICAGKLVASAPLKRRKAY